MTLFHSLRGFYFLFFHIILYRIRPQSAAEQINMCRVCTTVTPGHPQVILGKDKAFTFDHVYNVETMQDKVYNTCVKDLVNG